MFQLTTAETARLRSQTVISKARGGRRHRPYVFTEQGVAMLSSVLHSARAIAVNIEIMRAFVQLRGIARSHAALSKKLDELERKYDRRFKSVFDAIRYLMNPPARTARRQIGFRPLAINKRVGSGEALTDRGQRSMTREHRDDVLHGELNHRRPRLDRRAAKVRR
jgi:hypothetical protein